MFRIGDKGTSGIFNGTTGVVTGISLEDHAVTIHRSQGSEYPAVVILLTTGAWMIL